MATSLAGWVMLVAIVFAPATRIGYLLYPINFFVWAHMLRGADELERMPDDALAVATSSPWPSTGWPFLSPRRVPGRAGG